MATAHDDATSLARTVAAIRQAKDRQQIARIEAAFAERAPAVQIALLGDVVALALDRLRAAEEARRDALTGVLNRRGFFEAAAERVRREPGPDTVGLFDLDGLKAINDHHGHDAGSRALRAAADGVRAAFPGAVVGRIGGDEFAALIPDRSDTVLLRARLDATMRARAAMPDVTALRVSSGFATGVATRPTDVDDLLRRADTDLYARRSVARRGRPTSRAGRFLAHRPALSTAR